LEHIQEIHEPTVNGKMKKTWKAELLNAHSSNMMRLLIQKATSNMQRVAFISRGCPQLVFMQIDFRGDQDQEIHRRVAVVNETKYDSEFTPCK
jgi:predicted transcriptional regulator